MQTPHPWQLDQAQTPLLTALAHSARRDHAAFYAPGHKRGQGTPQPLKALLGTAVFAADLPELPELDNLFAPEGVIEAAQALAAEAFGADQSWFLANGSTCGIEAAVLAVCRPGDLIIVPRNVHQSVMSALILAGAVPIFVMPDYDPDWALVHGVAAATVAEALERFPAAKAVLIVSPTYHGVCADVAAIARLAHAHQVPLLVDEAHGPHFAFHPELPTPALAAGADLVVQSTHKVLSALTQASMLHVRGERIDRNRLQKALQLTQSTSPSYLLLASLDAARQQMALDGNSLMTQTLALAHRARQQIQTIPHLRILSAPPIAIETDASGFHDLDLTRLTVQVSGLGISGFDADGYLHETCGVTAELPTLEHLTFILSLGNREPDVDRLCQALSQLSQLSTPTQRSTLTAHPPVIPPTLPAVSPREAFFAPVRTVKLSQAIGLPSAETLCPYPPGIPVLFAGEVITTAQLEALITLHQQGARMTGCADPTLTTVQVIDPQ